MHLLITKVQKVSEKIKKISSSVAIYQPNHGILYSIDTNLSHPVWKTKVDGGTCIHMGGGSTLIFHINVGSGIFWGSKY